MPETHWKSAHTSAHAQGVSPVRMPTVIAGSGRPSRMGAWRMPASGARRLRSTSTASAFNGETYSTRQRASGFRWHRVGGQPVQCPEKRGQRRAGAGQRDYQRVLAGGDGLPGADEVFRYGRGDEAGQAEAVAYGRPVGVPDYQLDRQD
jgi:hypothetical protein